MEKLERFLAEKCLEETGNLGKPLSGMANGKVFPVNNSGNDRASK